MRTTGARDDGEDFYIGVDVGGTHTDICAVSGSRIERGKAFTTYDDFSRGVLSGLSVIAECFGITRDELLARTRLFVNGTTVVTNTITELNGSRVGVLVTTGFKDTLHIAGGPRIAAFDNHQQKNAPDLVRRADIVEIDGRLDWSGREVVPLDEDQIARAVRALVEESRIDALAICFMSSYLNPQHELAAAAVVRRLYPRLFVSLSHQLFPVVGETRRWTTAVLNSYVQSRAGLYLESLSSELSRAGLRGGLVFFQGLGGGISHERAKEFPLALLGSGPAGGAIAANSLAKRMGRKNVLLGDMGGTSFDTGIILDNEIRIERNLQLGLFQTGVSVVDVMSIGAGGGSIAWVGERGVPQVGPQSATSSPGPAAYGKGGTHATVTDAMVAMGIIDPERYLGGRFKLNPRLAESAIESSIGRHFGWSVTEAAAVIHDLAVSNMATAVHEVSVAKGSDPREFAFMAYGGTLPLFAVQIARQLNIVEVIIPANSSVFCALGLLATDFVMRLSRTVACDLSAGDFSPVNALSLELADTAKTMMQAEGFAPEDISLAHSADFRFLGQSFELSMPLSNEPLTAESARALERSFFELYERTYGSGTPWEGVPVQLLNYTVTVTGHRKRPPPKTVPLAPRDANEVLVSRRKVFLPTERVYREVPVYADEKFTAGTSLEGPAIIDALDTTIFVPTGTTIRRDEFLNYILTSREVGI